MFTLICKIIFRLTNSVRVSHDRVVKGAREQVVSIALYKCLNSNLFYIRVNVLTYKCTLITL